MHWIEKYWNKYSLPVFFEYLLKYQIIYKQRDYFIDFLHTHTHAHTLSHIMYMFVTLP